VIRVALVALALLAPAQLAAQEAGEALAGRIRVLDKQTGALTDLELARGEAEVVGRLTVGLSDCRYPVENPASDAWAHLLITDSAAPGAPVFAGWMLATSPALNALDNPRYDVWVLGCVLPEGALVPEGEATSEGEGE
jgi:hypothetical protein